MENEKADILAGLPLSTVLVGFTDISLRGNKWAGPSPFKAGGAPRAFTVDDKTGRWADKHTGTSGDVLAFLVEAKGFTEAEARDHVRGLVRSNLGEHEIRKSKAAIAAAARNGGTIESMLRAFAFEAERLREIADHSEVMDAFIQSGEALGLVGYDERAALEHVIRAGLDGTLSTATVGGEVAAAVPTSGDDGYGEPPLDWPGEPQQQQQRQRFALMRLTDIPLSKKRNYLVKGIAPRVGLVVVWGPPKCGKSFWVTDVLMRVALGWDYRGRRTVAGPVVYVVLEGADGFAARAEAFRLRYAKDIEWASVPFFCISMKMNLIADVQNLIADIRAQLGDEVPVAVAVDTLNRSFYGSENSDEDMGKYVRACDAIREAFGCATIIVHHCGIEGTRPRGHTSLTAAADAQIKVMRDSSNNVVASVEYMKDGREGAKVYSRLEAVRVGTDEDNEPVFSCVMAPLGNAQGGDLSHDDAPKPKHPPGVFLGTTRLTFFRDALLTTLKEHGVPAPAGKKVNSHTGYVADWAKVKEAYAAKVLPTVEDQKKHEAGLAKALDRLSQWFAQKGIIGVDNSGGSPIIWPTGKRVFSDGFAWPQVAEESKPDGDPTTASGETKEEVAKYL
jgi:hypothetical protein